MNSVLLSLLALGGMGLIFGCGLSIAGVKFFVNEDPLLVAVREALPSANCGGCGYAGCSALAEAIVSGEAEPDGCPVGGEESALEIAGLLGVEITIKERRSAFIKCAGGSGKSRFRYEYIGINDCEAAMQLAAGGSKACAFGCLGGGSCVIACGFGAVEIDDGIAVIDNEKCTACGNCVRVCPKGLIELVPFKSVIHVACNADETAKAVRQNCDAGCIGCKRCVRACKYEAMSVEDFLAGVDYGKCVNCGECVGVCPSKCVIDLRKTN